jgi:hypothetical protein
MSSQELPRTGFSAYPHHLRIYTPLRLPRSWCGEPPIGTVCVSTLDSLAGRALCTASETEQRHAGFTLGPVTAAPSSVATGDVPSCAAIEEQYRMGCGSVDKSGAVSVNIS